MPGALTKPIEQYTGDELYAFVQRLSFSGGPERDRRCRNAPGCEGVAAARRGAAGNDSTVRLGLALQEFDSDPMWAACSMGCCISQQ